MDSIIANICMINTHKLHLLNWGGGVSTDTLNSEAIIDKYRRL